MDDATLMEGWHGAVNDASEIVGNATDERIRKRGTAVLAWLQSHPPALTRQPVAGDGWRPIESAPRDRTVILGYWLAYFDGKLVDGAKCYALTMYHEGKWVSHDDPDNDWEPPTHWMPLPAAPAATPTDGGEGKS